MAGCSLTDNRKFRRLAKALGSRAMARGVLEMLWDTAYKTPEIRNGSLLGWTPEDIADAAGCVLETDLVTHLVATGWLDRTSDGGYRLHNYLERCPDFVIRRIARSLVQDGVYEWSTKASRGDLRRDMIRRCYSHSNINKHEETKTNMSALDEVIEEVIEEGVEEGISASTPSTPPTGGSQCVKRKRKKPKPDFAVVDPIYQVYPRHVGKADARNAIGQALKILIDRENCPDPAAWLLSRVTAYAAAVSRWPEEDRRQFVPYPATWMRAGRYDDDDREWERAGNRGLTRIQAPPGKYDHVPTIEA